MFFWGGLRHWGTLEGGLLGLLVSQLLIFPVVSLFALVFGVVFNSVKPTIQVQNGKIRVLYGDCYAVERSLSGCEWSVGPLRRVNYFLGGQAVLIVLPGEKKGEEAFVAAGFDPESRFVWETFLTLAGIRRRRRA